VTLSPHLMPLSATSQYVVSDTLALGQFTKAIKGRYGMNLIENYRYAMGLIVPSPDSRFIVYVGGRPYLNISYDTNKGGHGLISYCRGFFTEVIDNDGAIGLN